jgi:hypothetical protein
MVVIRDDLTDTVAESNALGAACGAGEEYFRCRRVGVFVEEMVLDFPRVVETQTVRENDLVEGLLKESVLVALVPRFRKLQFVENAKSQSSSPCRVGIKVTKGLARKF